MNTRLRIYSGSKIVSPSFWSALPMKLLYNTITAYNTWIICTVLLSSTVLPFSDQAFRKSMGVKWHKGMWRLLKTDEKACYGKHLKDSLSPRKYVTIECYWVLTRSRAIAELFCGHFILFKPHIQASIVELSYEDNYRFLLRGTSTKIHHIFTTELCRVWALPLQSSRKFRIHSLLPHFEMYLRPMGRSNFPLITLVNLLRLDIDIHILTIFAQQLQQLKISSCGLILHGEIEWQIKLRL